MSRGANHQEGLQGKGNGGGGDAVRRLRGVEWGTGRERGAGSGVGSQHAFGMPACIVCCVGVGVSVVVLLRHQP